MDQIGSPARANGKRRAGAKDIPLRASFFTRTYRYLKKYWFQLYCRYSGSCCFLLVFEYAPMYGITLAFKDYSRVLACSAALGSVLTTSGR